MSQQTSDLQLILYQALGEPIGLLLEVSDFARARQALYRARAEAKDPDLAGLQFRASPGLDGGNLIIVKGTVQIAGSSHPSLQAGGESTSS